MGLYTISCPTCKRAHVWSSAGLNPDTRCAPCREGEAFAAGDQWPAGVVQRFSEWARNPRTVRLMERCRNAEVARNKLAKRVEELEKFNVGLAQESHDLRGELKIVQEERDLLRTTKSILEVYKRSAERRLKKIDELNNTVKVNSDFIELQGGRLRKARAMIQRICISAGLHVPDESSLDP